jgi:hypothetical protein
VQCYSKQKNCVAVFLYYVYIHTVWRGLKKHFLTNFFWIPIYQNLFPYQIKSQIMAQSVQLNNESESVIYVVKGGEF